jgi:flagellar hook-associated protein 2
MEPIGTISGIASGIQWRDMIDQIMRGERIRQVDPLSRQVSLRQSRIDAWRTFEGLVSKLTTASRALRDGSAFDHLQVAVHHSPTSGRALFSASAGTGAAPGTYAVEVRELARATKLGSGAHASATAALNLTGGYPVDDVERLDFWVNGRRVEVSAGDSLEKVRDAINAVNTGANASGVGATILSAGPNDVRLILSAAHTGSRGIELVDGEGGALQQLNLVTNTQLPNTADGGTQTQRFASSTTPVASLLGLTSPPQIRNIVIDGQEIQVDLTTDTLQTLLDKVRTAVVLGGGDPDAAARLVTETVGGRTFERLEVAGTVTAADADPDSQRIVELLGFARPAAVNTITAGSDAVVEIDGHTVTRRSNTVSDVLSGVTLTLQQAEIGTVVDFTVSRADDPAVNAARSFVNAYNDVIGFVRQQSTTDAPLAFNSTLRNAVGSLTNVLLTPIEELDTQFTRAPLVGISLTKTGQLELNEGTFREALATHREDVRTLFAGVEGTAGLAGRFMEITELLTRSGDGLVAGQTETLQRSIDSLNSRKDAAELRMEVRRESLVRQFTRMEEALNRIQAQGNWLYQQMQAMRPRER